MDPYQVLGVSRNATMDEITQAYRKLAKQYHPDLHPNDASAEAKMKAINQAYDQIQSGNFSDFQSTGTSFSDIEVAITNRQFAWAWQRLSQETQRPSRWYYLASIALTGLGDVRQADSYLREALRQEPYNQEYRFFESQLRRRQSTFSTATGFRVPLILKWLFYLFLFQWLGRVLVSLF